MTGITNQSQHSFPQSQKCNCRILSTVLQGVAALGAEMAQDGICSSLIFADDGTEAQRGEVTSLGSPSWLWVLEF